MSLQRKNSAHKIAYLFILLTVFFSGVSVAELSDAAKRGRHLYYHGTKSNGESLTANIGAASIPVPASTVTCANCHGRDAKGRPEGGVIPSDIRWNRLSSANGGESSVGRKYKQYTINSLLKAVSEGIDSSGNQLDKSMPRFNISKSDARDLAAYLKVIEDDFDPGISKDEIVIGTLQPENRPHSLVSGSMTSVINAYFNDINNNGGVYGRKLKLKTVQYKNEADFVSMADELAANENVFALLNSFSAQSDETYVKITENNRIPSLAPFTQFPSATGSQFHYTFYLDGGLESQVRVLLQRALSSVTKKGRVYLLYRDASNIKSVIEKIRTSISDKNAGKIEFVSYSPGLKDIPGFTKKTVSKSDSLLFAGLPMELVQVTTGNTSAKHFRKVFLPGYFVTRDIMKLPADLSGKIEMAYVTVPGKMKPKVLSEFKAFMVRNKLKFDYLPMRIFAYNAARTLVHALKLSGKRINRDVFIAAMEGLHSFDLGTTAPLRYGSQRRVGLTGAHIVRINPGNKQFETMGKWVKLD